MHVSWQTSRALKRGPARLGAGGFTSGEMLLGLLVVLLAAILLFMVAARLAQRARGERLGRDLQAIAAAFEQAHTASGRWPQGPEEVPHLGETPWAEASPFGGHYGWVPPKPPVRPGAITLTAFSPDLPLELTRVDLLGIDRQIDDGDLTTGRFRAGFNGWPIYLVGEQP